MTEADDDDDDDDGFDIHHHRIHHEFPHPYDHRHHRHHQRRPRSTPPRDRRSPRVPTAAERRQAERLFLEEMRMIMAGSDAPSVPVEWWESEGLSPPGAR
jgi:hypothetical protein